MSKKRLIACPGCDHGFMEGMSLSQHLFRSIVCKRVVDTSRGWPFDGFGAAVAPEPVVPIDLSDEDDSFIAAPIEYDEELSITVGPQAESDLAENGSPWRSRIFLKLLPFLMPLRTPHVMR